jgi:hypothetical protein
VRLSRSTQTPSVTRRLAAMGGCSAAGLSRLQLLPCHAPHWSNLARHAVPKGTIKFYAASNHNASKSRHSCRRAA